MLDPFGGPEGDARLSCAIGIIASELRMINTVVEDWSQADDGPLSDIWQALTTAVARLEEVRMRVGALEAREQRRKGR